MSGSPQPVRGRAGPPFGSEKARRTYETLVSATRESIRDEGTFSPARVAERAGVAAATFYAYFSSREDALAAAFEQILEEFHARTVSWLSIEALLEDGLEEVCRTFAWKVVRFYEADHGTFRLALSRLSTDRSIRDVVRRSQSEGLEHIERFLTLGMAAGKVRPGDAAKLGMAMLVLVQGLNNPLLMRPDAEHQGGTIELLADALHQLLALHPAARDGESSAPLSKSVYE